MTEPRRLLLPPRRAAPYAALLVLLLAMAPPRTGSAGETVLRVGSSGDYAPFSQRGDAGLTGFDVEVARRYARDRGLRIEWVPFRWGALEESLRAGRFELAMGGVTVRPDRSVVGRFSLPLAESGAVLLVPRSAPWQRASDLDRQGLRLAVNAGGHLERVVRRRLPRAQRLALPNEAVLPALLAGRVDAAVSDSQEAPGWLARHPELRAIGPFTRDRKAALARRERGDLAADLDRWILARERDGTLAELRRRWGVARAAVPATRPALEALVAALDERLALMPWVALRKAAAGLPVRVPDREEQVLDAAEAAARAAAAAAGVAPPASAPLRRFFRTQMAAARRVQAEVLTDAEAFEQRVGAPPPGVALAQLRAALLRIGERVARLVMALPPDLRPGEIDASLSRGLIAHPATDAERASMASALHALARSGARPPGL